MNKERLLNVAKALREAPEPEKFTMIQFVHLAPEGGCGSPACALGHYAFRQDLQSAFTQDTFGPQSGIGCASEEVLEHFGITEMQACQLFDSRGCDDANTPTEAADYIEKFVETDGEHGRVKYEALAEADIWGDEDWDDRDDEDDYDDEP